MHSQSWAEYGTGLVLTDDWKHENHKLWDLIIPQLCKSNDIEPEAPDDLTDIAERLEEKLGVYCRYISSGEFEGLCFRSINGWSEEPAEMFVISTEKIPDLLKQAYASKEELVGEFRQYFKELPEDFNLETHIGYYSASIFC